MYTMVTFSKNIKPKMFSVLVATGLLLETYAVGLASDVPATGSTKLIDILVQRLTIFIKFNGFRV